MWEQQYGRETYEFQGQPYEYPSELMGESYGELQRDLPTTSTNEMELACEFLTVTNEAELDQFLGGLMKKVGGFVKSPVGQALGGILKGVAKKALPIVGGAIGSFVAPGVGTAIGSSLGSAAGKLLGLELEGLSPEDREFEVARRYVRLATAATRNAAAAPHHLPPHQIARRAFAMAARQHAPGLIVTPTTATVTTFANPPSNLGNDTDWSMPATTCTEVPQSGHWVRRGRNLIIYGA